MGPTSECLFSHPVGLLPVDFPLLVLHRESVTVAIETSASLQ